MNTDNMKDSDRWHEEFDHAQKNYEKAKELYLSNLRLIGLAQTEVREAEHTILDREFDLTRNRDFGFGSPAYNTLDTEDWGKFVDDALHQDFHCEYLLAHSKYVRNSKIEKLIELKSKSFDLRCELENAFRKLTEFKFEGMSQQIEDWTKNSKDVSSVNSTNDETF